SEGRIHLYRLGFPDRLHHLIGRGTRLHRIDRLVVGTSFLAKGVVVFGFLGRPVSRPAPFRVEFRVNSRAFKVRIGAVRVSGSVYSKQTAEPVEMRSSTRGGFGSDRIRAAISSGRARSNPTCKGIWLGTAWAVHLRRRSLA